MQAILFLNYSDLDFTGKWDGVEYTVKAGESMLLQDYIAQSLAKDFTMREMNRESKTALINQESASFKERFLKALPGDAPVVMDSPEKVEMEVVKRKGGRPKKVEEKVEVEFPDLKK